MYSKHINYIYIWVKNKNNIECYYIFHKKTPFQKTKTASKVPPLKCEKTWCITLFFFLAINPEIHHDQNGQYKVIDAQNRYFR